MMYRLHTVLFETMTGNIGTDHITFQCAIQLVCTRILDQNLLHSGMPLRQCRRANQAV